jgi:hypothetical protein
MGNFRSGASASAAAHVRWGRAVRLSLALVTGCSGRAAPPPLPPPPSLAAELAAARSDTRALCAFVLAHPGTLEAQTARGLAEHDRATAEAAFRASAAQHELPAELRLAVERHFALGVVDPCAYAVGLEIVEENDDGAAWRELVMPDGRTRAEVVETSAAAADAHAQMHRDLPQALYAALGGTWNTFEREGNVRFRFHVRRTIPGMVVDEHQDAYPALAVDPFVEISADGIQPAVMTLRRVVLPDGFSVSYTARAPGEPPPTASVLDQELRELVTAVFERITEALHLVDPDPVLFTLPRRLALEGATSGDGCAGEIVLAARNIAIDPWARTLFADVVDRTYAARAMAGGVVAEVALANESDCAGTDVVERWTLVPRPDGALVGGLESTWLLPPTCATPCTISFGIVARPSP